mmetsp:Transcript_16259/g.49682  ORF Transcript_16259/g.49682 Transcript_16259/m.49682 type:complete len:383 (-) Transcript_16259:804-1952(-)
MWKGNFLQHLRDLAKKKDHSATPAMGALLEFPEGLKGLNINHNDFAGWSVDLDVADQERVTKFRNYIDVIAPNNKRDGFLLKGQWESPSDAVSDAVGDDEWKWWRRITIVYHGCNAALWSQLNLALEDAPGVCKIMLVESQEPDDNGFLIGKGDLAWNKLFRYLNAQNEDLITQVSMDLSNLNYKGGLDGIETFINKHVELTTRINQLFKSNTEKNKDILNAQLQAMSVTWTGHILSGLTDGPMSIPVALRTMIVNGDLYNQSYEEVVKKLTSWCSNDSRTKRARKNHASVAMAMSGNRNKMNGNNNKKGKRRNNNYLNNNSKRRKTNFSGRCYNCGERGHTAKDCTKKMNKSKTMFGPLKDKRDQSSKEDPIHYGGPPGEE